MDPTSLVLTALSPIVMSKDYEYTEIFFVLLSLSFRDGELREWHWLPVLMEVMMCEVVANWRWWMLIRWIRITVSRIAAANGLSSGQWTRRLVQCIISHGSSQPLNLSNVHLGPPVSLSLPAAAAAAAAGPRARPRYTSIQNWLVLGLGQSQLSAGDKRTRGMLQAITSTAFVCDGSSCGSYNFQPEWLLSNATIAVRYFQF